MKINTKNIYAWVLMVVCALLITVFTNEFGAFASPVILTSVILGFTYFLLWRVEPNVIYKQSQHNALSWVLWFLLVGLASGWIYIIFKQNPIDIKQSDIIPLIKEIYVNRLLNNEEVYAPIEGYGYGNWWPNYLPMHWLPFVLPYMLGFDPRWMAFASFILAALFYQISLQKFKQHIIEHVIKTALPFLFLTLLFLKQPVEIAHTVELMIAAFYMFLATILVVNRNGVLKSIALTLTTLSRFTVVFCLPFIFITDTKYNKRDLVLIYGLFVFLILLIYIAPFLRQNPFAFFYGTQAYDIAALGEWKGQSWQNPGDAPFQLFRGFGFASYIYSFVGGSLENKIATLKIVLLVIMAFNLAFWFLVQPKIKNKFLMQAVVLFVTLYLFFAWVLVPYNYLFWNVLFVLPVLMLPVNFVKK